MEKLALAYETAKKYHAGQKDRAGKDYINHVKFVSDQRRSFHKRLLHCKPLFR